MELNGIPMRAYEDHGTYFDFYLEHCSFDQAAKLDGKPLVISNNMQDVRRFEGLRAVSIEQKDGYIAYRAARKLDPDTESAIVELQQNLKIAEQSMAEANAKAESLEAQLDAASDVIDLLIAQSGTDEEEAV